MADPNGGIPVDGPEQLFQQLQAQAAKLKNRPIFWFTVPERIAGSTGCSKIGMVELTTDEEMMAARRCRSEPIRLAYELARESLRWVDSRFLSSADGSAETVWANLNPKLRQLVMVAYDAIHNPAKEETSDFLKSQSIAVG